MNKVASKTRQVRQKDTAEIFTPHMSKKFDVVAMNPPYEKPDGGHGRSAGPLYHKFIEKVIDEIQPNYLVSINPSRWMIGGKGLDEFRTWMMNRQEMRTIVHFPGSYTVFPSVKIDGGVNYFLWEKGTTGPCDFMVDGTHTKRYLNQHTDIIIQDNNAVPILDKVQTTATEWMHTKVFGRKPFGLGTNFSDWQSNGTPCYCNQQKVKFAKNFTDTNGIIGKWKVAMSTAYGEAGAGPFRVIGQPFVIKPGEICTETYIIVNAFGTKKEAENFITYVKTKFFRFMLLLRKPTQHINTDKFAWVPDLQDYSRSWTDEQLYDKFDLDQKERAYIEKKIKPIVEKK